ncbi:MAG: hypothetical protein JO336_00930 [Acidobacteriia bacterium]|nr:hypothetical protein [Terriglobia bacterium]
MSRRILPVAAILALAGCGYEGQPLPPLANVPGRVTAVAAKQRGSLLVVEVTPPQLTTEGFPIKPPPSLDVRAGIAHEPFNEAAWAASARKLMPVEPREYEVPVSEWAGKELTVGVRAIGANGKDSGWSFESVPVVAVLVTPSDVTAKNVAAGVEIEWNGSGAGYRIYRKTNDNDFAPVADVPQSPWTDTSTQYDQQYEYKVQRVVKVSDTREAESELSAEARITPKDIFPPAVPSNLEATPAPASVELSWNSDTEPDLASYRVYRSVNGAPFEKAAELELPAWSDRDVQAGKSYRYEVTAVDRLGNESERSPAVEARLQ